jgi:hypothetical protein
MGRTPKNVSRPRPTAQELDDLIGEITVDTYNDDEALTGFEVAFDDRVSFPLSGTVVGHEVEVMSVSIPNGRRELIARCKHGGSRYDVALLDVDCSGDFEFDRILAAYRQWLGA